MGSGVLAGIQKCKGYFGAKVLPSVYSDHVGAPAYSKASQAVSCPDTVCGTEVSGIGVPGKGSGGNKKNGSTVARAGFGILSY